MTRNPKTIAADSLAAEAVDVMEQRPITSLFVLSNGSRRPIGVIHLHDLVKSGIV
jgi:arabinose-5-phosphate isomerase